MCIILNMETILTLKNAKLGGPFFMIGTPRWCLGNFSWWRSLIRISYRFLSNKQIDEIVEKRKPDLVFCAKHNLSGGSR